MTSVERTRPCACLHKQETSLSTSQLRRKMERNPVQRAKVCQHAKHSCIKATNQTTTSTPKRRANSHMCPAIFFVTALA